MTIQFKCRNCKKDISMLISNWNHKMMDAALFLRAEELCYSCLQEIRRAEYEIMQSRQSAKMWTEEFPASQTPSEV